MNFEAFTSYVIVQIIIVAINKTTYWFKLPAQAFFLKARFLMIRSFKKCYAWASLVAQWLRIRLPTQGTWVPALVWEDPTCRGATKPVRHSY